MGLSRCQLSRFQWNIFNDLNLFAVCFCSLLCWKVSCRQFCCGWHHASLNPCPYALRVIYMLFCKLQTGCELSHCTKKTWLTQCQWDSSISSSYFQLCRGFLNCWSDPFGWLLSLARQPILGRVLVIEVTVLSTVSFENCTGLQSFLDSWMSVYVLPCSFTLIWRRIKANGM